MLLFFVDPGGTVVKVRESTGNGATLGAAVTLATASGAVTWPVAGSSLLPGFRRRLWRDCVKEDVGLAHTGRPIARVRPEGVRSTIGADRQ